MKELKPKSIDLYESFFLREEISREQRKHVVAMGIPIFLLVCLVGAGGYFKYNIWSMEKEMMPVSAYIQDSANEALYQRAIAIKENLEKLRATRDNMAQAEKALDSYPELNAEMLTDVYKLVLPKMKINKLEYTLEGGQLVIEANCANASDASDYVEKLLDSRHFDSVTYEGYSSEKDGKQTITLTQLETEAVTGPAFGFTVTAYLKTPVGVTK